MIFELGIQNGCWRASGDRQWMQRGSTRELVKCPSFPEDRDGVMSQCVCSRHMSRQEPFNKRLRNSGKFFANPTDRNNHQKLLLQNYTQPSFYEVESYLIKVENVTTT